MSVVAEKLEITDELIAERRGDPTGKLPEDMPVWMGKSLAKLIVSAFGSAALCVG